MLPIQPGQTLLHYRIVDKIGEGGMGVVWKATDTSLGRDVAIKVLPATWAGDAQRLQRFEREARLLASLNHPNVATVHGLHEAEGSEGAVRFIVMEWVPGEDLATRLERGPLELEHEQALQVASRVAQGLEAAHAAGVVHRDLKPANIRMTPDGAIKVLDFGLAKAAMADTSGDPELSPTLTSAGTQAGVVLGTAAYMSPEQAKGIAVDRRADIWAFGVVLYEMLTGAGAFRGDSIAVLSADGKTVKSVFHGGYSARYLPGGYLVFMLNGGLFAVPFDLDRLEATPPAVSVQPKVWTDSVWGNARFDTSFDGTLVFVSGGDFARTVPTWIDLETGEEEPLPVPPGVYNNFDLSPDGTLLAIQNASGAQDQVYVHDSSRGTFTRLTLDGANIYPVWSHHGRELFFASSRDGEGYRLYRKPIDGSAPASRLLTDEQEALMETDLRFPVSVTPDGKFLLLYTWAHPARGGDLWKVPLDGPGDPEAVLATEANEIIPQVSPDGKWLAYLTDRDGPYRIMVRPFPEVERREWVVSGVDGYDPLWSPRGDALLYRQGWRRLMRTPVGDGEELAPGVALKLLETDFHDAAGPSFVVSPDGKRVLVNKPVEVSLLDETPVTLVTGWAEEVSRVLGAN